MNRKTHTYDPRYEICLLSQYDISPPRPVIIIDNYMVYTA